MVEIMLPKNSRVKKGKVWPADKAANGKKPKRTKEFKVYRYNPDEGSNPTVVVNETAARKLGFASPEAAVGQIIAWRRKG
jgi:succinate dehydrogenase / fumarate reductase iron-sulfur subunit